MILLTLPYPPTANHLYFVRHGRKVLSAAGRAYKAEVARLVAEMGSPKAPPGRLLAAIDVYPPDRRRRDIANCEKIAIDSAKQAGVIEDDCLIDVLILTRMGVVPGGLVVVCFECLGV